MSNSDSFSQNMAIAIFLEKRQRYLISDSLIVVPKAIRQKIEKNGGDKVVVTIKERGGEREYLC